ncbi:unnamed protein product [Rhizoctonia solani]|uniref:Secreted protein n=1 Tax=Rhizoctonia solani TaxID=456999 RepID=A0A8H2W7R1_9AGAM|nr:unnamed protein product [Rhizoctonia solani]
MIFATGLVVAVAVVGSSAQSLTNLSTSCQAAAATIVAGPASECLGASGLINIAMTDPNDSLVAPIDNWLKMTCAHPPCTNATIDAAISNITKGCMSDLNSAGINASTWQYMNDFVREWYPVARQIACLKNGDSFCVTTTLQDIEDWVGQPLSKNTIENVIPKIVSTTEIPANLTCTDCTKAAYALIRPHLNDTERGNWDNVATEQCGSGFINGTAPS